MALPQDRSVVARAFSAIARRCKILHQRGKARLTIKPDGMPRPAPRAGISRSARWRAAAPCGAFGGALAKAERLLGHEGDAIRQGLQPLQPAFELRIAAPHPAGKAMTRPISRPSSSGMATFHGKIGRAKARLDTRQAVSGRLEKMHWITGASAASKGLVPSSRRAENEVRLSNGIRPENAGVSLSSERRQPASRVEPSAIRSTSMPQSTSAS